MIDDQGGAERRSSGQNSMEFTIQELIDLLKAAKRQHGNLQCVYEGCRSLSPAVVVGKNGKVMNLVSGQ